MHIPVEVHLNDNCCFHNENISQENNTETKMNKTLRCSFWVKKFIK